MENGKKAAIGATLLVVLVAGVRSWMVYRERNAPEAPVVKQEAKIDDDDLVYLKKKLQSSLEDAKDLKGSTLWVSAGGQMDYYAYAGHHADYSKSKGILLAAVPLVVKDAFEQVAPKKAAFRIPAGDRHVLLVFTLPKSDSPTTEYAVPVGYKEGKFYTFYIDEIFFYDDPHELYKYWGPDVWKAIDEHRVINGMSEREVQLALGQVSKSTSNDYGNRMVVYSNLGKPMAVTFVKNKVTAVRADQGY
ncbi:hypothetical protein [Granulicella arctica]|uniref:Uncharacterized protein n=1 Tax=Granulicella arctica TaxID=940613 RepID=A0A7Y9PED2_9BACT|nr:hypothetical protein [Granulicella arctica]NYF78257.1 hypothetical protein [Granulicella arctica]